MKQKKTNLQKLSYESDGKMGNVHVNNKQKKQMDRTFFNNTQSSE